MLYSALRNKCVGELIQSILDTVFTPVVLYVCLPSEVNLMN